MTGTEHSRWRQGEISRPIFLAILLLALAVRVVGAIPDFFHFYDEVWQYLEPAYGLVHGRWVRTWEYREGIRSWLVPTVFAGPFGLASTLGLDSHAAIVSIRMVLAVASLSIVYAGMSIAARLSALHTLVVGLVRYVTEAWRLWNVFLVPFVVLVAIGTRRSPVLVTVALVNIAFHSMIAHKELRFIFPSIALLLTVAALGGADLLGKVRGRRARVMAMAFLTAVFVGQSAAALGSATGRQRFRGKQQIDAWRMAHGQPDICGIAAYGPNLTPPLAYAFLDRPVELYIFAERDRSAALYRNRFAIDAVLAATDDTTTIQGAGFRLQGCSAKSTSGARGSARYCLYRRAGGCRGGDPRYLAGNANVRLGN